MNTPGRTQSRVIRGGRCQTLERGSGQPHHLGPILPLHRQRRRQNPLIVGFPNHIGVSGVEGLGFGQRRRQGLPIT